METQPTGKLGFGLMRLPRKGISIDLKQVMAMTDLFLQAGFNYFDTAYLYPGSEAAAKKALVERWPRDCFMLATKLNVMFAPTEKAARKQFETSLERTGAGYFDYYLLHALMDNNVSRYERFRLWDFVNEQKAKGLIRKIGFSFHAGPELLEQLLREHPEVDFVQLQLNYADWENPRVTSRANYEMARKYNKPIVVMEPVKGGKLAEPPEEVCRLFHSVHPDLSCASWAIRFAASLDGVLTVLSGMSNLDQMRDNLRVMQHFEPLSAEEQQVIHEAQRILGHSSAIPCTACGYCTEGCPRRIRIPDIIRAMNLRAADGRWSEAENAYHTVTAAGSGAGDCIGCRQCESMCPQHLEITELLRQAACIFESGDGKQ